MDTVHVDENQHYDLQFDKHKKRHSDVLNPTTIDDIQTQDPTLNFDLQLDNLSIEFHHLL